MSLITLVAAATQGFDVEAATRAYLDTLAGPARAKSDAYFQGGYWLILWNALVTAASCWILLRTGWSARFSAWAARTGRRRWLAPSLYAVPFVIATTIIQLPWAIYTGFFREKQYGLMNQSFGQWLGEQGVALIVSIVTTALLLMMIFAVIRRLPRGWWLAGTLAMTGFMAIGAVIAPLFIMPLFNSYTPMKPGPLRDEILAMAHSHNIPADNIYVVDASRQSKRISANVSGLGPTIRISLNDNLLNRSTPAEIKSVMGHEMGHYVLNHVWWSLAGFSLIFLAGFLLLYRLAPRLLARWGRGWGVHDVADPAVTPLFLIIASFFGIIATPAVNSLIRVDESQADAFGLDVAREPDGFANIAMKLSEYRKIEPGPIEEVIFFDHPSGHTRVHMAMQWKADHLAEVEAKEKQGKKPAQ